MEPMISEPHHPSAVSNHLGNPLTEHVSHPPLVLIKIENGKVLLLSITPLAQVSEVCAVELKIPALLKTHEGINMMPDSGISWGFSSLLFKRSRKLHTTNYIKRRLLRLQSEALKG